MTDTTPRPASAAGPTGASNPSDGADDLPEILRRLQRGEGHELVTMDNVDALIALARERGHPAIEQLLQAWRSDCGGVDGRGGQPPSTIAPTPGFNKDHVRH